MFAAMGITFEEAEHFITGHITEGQIFLSRDLHRKGVYPPPLDLLPVVNAYKKQRILVDTMPPEILKSFLLAKATASTETIEDALNYPKGRVAVKISQRSIRLELSMNRLAGYVPAVRTL